MQPQMFESLSSNVHEQLADIFEERPSEELFSLESHTNIDQNLSIPIEAPPETSLASFDLQPEEIRMHTENPPYNYSNNSDPLDNDLLSQRLFTLSEEPNTNSEAQSAFDTLKHLIDTNAMALHTSYPTEKNSISNYFSIDIENTIQDFHQYQSTQLTNYLERWLNRPALPDQLLQIFQGWELENETSHSLTSFAHNPSKSFNSTSPLSLSGFYFRWNNKGVVVNPGKNFMNHFHKAGLHIKDIDVVIVTHSNKDAFADIQEIYELSFKLSRASGEQQTIQYFLNQKTYQELSVQFKPHSKSERDAIHCLELFAESPEIEQIKIADGIQLHYFTNRPQYNSTQSFSRQQTQSSNLGIRFDLSNLQGGNISKVTLGYISGMGWSPFISQHLEKCDILLAGIGETSQSDFNKVVHIDNCLGYYGICSLLEDALPKLLICTEFDSQTGDLRLELIKKMRSEYSNIETTILPADIGMCVDLKTQNVKCTVTQQYIQPTQIKVTRTAGLFSPMHYLAPSNYL